MKAFLDNVESFENDKCHVAWVFEGFASIFTLGERNLRNDFNKSLDVSGKYTQNHNVIKFL